MVSILFVCLHRPNRSPSQRFRFEQYLSFLKNAGYQTRFSFLLNANEDKIEAAIKFYKKAIELDPAYGDAYLNSPTCKF